MDWRLEREIHSKPDPFLGGMVFVWLFLDDVSNQRVGGAISFQRFPSSKLSPPNRCNLWSCLLNPEATGAVESGQAGDKEVLLCRR